MRRYYETRHAVHLAPLELREDRTLEQRIADGDACGVRFARHCDGAEEVCDLPRGHVTRTGEPSAHAWDSRR